MKWFYACEIIILGIIGIILNTFYDSEFTRVLGAYGVFVGIIALLSCLLDRKEDEEA